MPGHILVLVASSGAGKTTSLEHYGRGNSNNPKSYKGTNQDLRTTVPWKQSTRPPKKREFEIMTVSDLDRITYDLWYRLYGNYYGISSGAIERAIEEGLTPSMVVNDTSTIGRMQDRWGDLVVPVYIHSNTTETDIKRLQEAQKQLKGELTEAALDLARRLETRTDIYKQFVAHPTFFRHVVLNTGSLEDLYRQLDTLASSYMGPEDMSARESRAKKGPHIFILDGASGSGRKSTILDIINNDDDVYNVPKFGVREERPDDDPRIIRAVAQIPSRCDVVYEMFDTSYGIELAEIEGGLNRGQHVLIATSDSGAIQRIKELYGSRASLVYMFANRNASRERIKQRQSADESSRLSAADKSFESYIAEMHGYAYNVLNAGTLEEKATQMRCIIAAHN